MTIDELAELTQRGFDGVHQRLDALNGRTRQNEVGVAELKVQASQWYDHDRRLRAVEVKAALDGAFVEDLKAHSRREGIKWGAIVSTGLTIVLYLVSHFTGIPLK